MTKIAEESINSGNPLVMNIEQVESLPPITVINLEGYIDRTTRHLFDKGLNTILGSNYRYIIINCEKLIPESGDGIIYMYTSKIKTVKDKNGSICFTNISNEHYKVLERNGWLKVIEIFNNNEMAISWYKNMQ